jgi:hypothetical protein
MRHFRDHLRQKDVSVHYHQRSNIWRRSETKARSARSARSPPR